MRKKSHILLATYIANNIQQKEIHRKAFCLGNILPDLRPSFLLKRHEYFGTIRDTEDKINELSRINNDRVYWRRLGEIIHYIADYFTFPHNKTFSGGLSEHNKYEKDLKNTLKDCVKNGHACKYIEPPVKFKTISEIVDYIRYKHNKYLSKTRNIQDDISYILNVCFQIAQGILNLRPQKHLNAT